MTIGCRFLTFYPKYYVVSFQMKLAAGPISKAAFDAEHWLLEGAQMAGLSVKCIFIDSAHS